MEIGDWRRLTGRSAGAYLGLVPTEYSSGASRSQGGITKTGNVHALSSPGLDKESCGVEAVNGIVELH